MLRTTILITFLFCIASAAIAQTKTSDYIVKDSVYIQGIVIPESRERIMFKKFKIDKPVAYGPNTISEYSYDGIVYESLSIHGKNVFVLKLTSKGIVLYKIDGTYILKKDGKTITFSHKDFRRILHAQMNCAGDTALSRLTYSKTSIRNYIRAYQAGKCNADFFPQRKFGIHAGVNVFSYQMAQGNIFSQNSTVPSFTIGIFGDFPLYKPAGLYFSAELNWMAAKASYDYVDKDPYHFATNLTGVIVPVGFKWVGTTDKIKPYFKVGALISHFQMKIPDGLQSTKLGVTTIQQIPNESSLMLGFQAAAGFEVSSPNNHAMHVELKYMSLSRAEFGNFDLSMSGVMATLGFSL